jgi:hypothetical protein
MFRPPKTPPPEDMFSEFPAEHDLLLWPEASHDRKPSDAFNEFAPEDDMELDRWLAVARSQQPTLATVPDYRHPIAVAAVVLSLLTPAGIIGMFILDSHVTAVHEAVLTAAPLPVGLLEASSARPAALPPSFQISAPRVQPTESKPASVPAPARPVKTVPKPSPSSAFVSPSGLLPFTNAVLSASRTALPAAGSSAATPLVESPRAPVSPPPAPAAPPPTPAGLPAMRVVSPPASATIPPAPEAIPDSVAVRTALDRYRRGFNELDSSEVKAIWPDVDQKDLSRAFSQLSRQLFVFDTCKVDVKGVLATASCRGRAQYVPKVGNKSPRVELREWTFLLQKGPDDWWIRTVDSK